jgi:hypothetical protein
MITSELHVANRGDDSSELLAVVEAKKCGAESSDPNRHSQPRLPGSVVGEASMRQRAACDKITKVSALLITSGQAESDER